MPTLATPRVRAAIVESVCLVAMLAHVMTRVPIAVSELTPVAVLIVRALYRALTIVWISEAESLFPAVLAFSVLDIRERKVLVPFHRGALDVMIVCAALVMREVVEDDVIA